MLHGINLAAAVMRPIGITARHECVCGGGINEGNMQVHPSLSYDLKLVGGNGPWQTQATVCSCS